MRDKATQSVFRQAKMNFMLHFLRKENGKREDPYPLELFRYKNGRPDGWTYHQIEKTIGDLIVEGLVELVPDEGWTRIVLTPKGMDTDHAES